MQPKISLDYIEKLRVKFLDTRPTLAKPIASGESTNSPTAQTNSLIAAADGQNGLTSNSKTTLSAKEYDQLIYANVMRSDKRVGHVVPFVLIRKMIIGSNKAV